VSARVFVELGFDGKLGNSMEQIAHAELASTPI
jgi:hypothetical protein